MEGINTYLRDVRMAMEQRLEKMFNQDKVFKHSNDLERAVKRIVKSRGKMNRARTYFLVSSSIESEVPYHAKVSVGSLLEQFQLFALIHDDLIDKDTHRRGVPTIHYAMDELEYPNQLKEGAAFALLVGDYVLNDIYKSLLEINVDNTLNLQLHRCFTTMAREAVTGQLHELCLGKTEPLVRRMDDIELMIDLKTSRYSYYWPIRIGLLTVADDRSDWLDHFSRIIGLAFQIKNDISGLQSCLMVDGKAQGTDEELGRPTYIASLAQRLGCNTNVAVEYAHQMINQLKNEGYATLQKCQSDNLRHALAETIHF